MAWGKMDAPVVSGEKGVFELPASSDLLAEGGLQVLVPGRKRLTREAHDSDSDDEEEAASSLPFKKKKPRTCVYSAAASFPKTATKGSRLKRRLDDEESDCSEEEVQYIRTERAELSQSLLTSWLVPRGAEKGACV